MSHYVCKSTSFLQSCSKSSCLSCTGNLPLSVGLPLHVNELKDIEPQLTSLVALYKIDAVSIFIIKVKQMIYIVVLCNSRITTEPLYITPLFIGPYAAANNTALLA